MSSPNQRSSVSSNKIMLRNALAASVIAAAVTTSTGCSTSRPSFASLNPFAKKEAAPSTLQSQPNSGETSFASSIAGGAKGAATKSRDTVVGWFKSDDSKTENQTTSVESKPDPLRLDTKSEISTEVFVANGRMWERSGKLDKAMASYAKALEKNPNDPNALNSIGRLHFRQGDHSKAVEYLSQSVKQNPNEATLHHDLGVAQSRMGDHQGATQSLQRALELKPGTSRFANGLASVRFDAGDTEGAFAVLQKNNKPAVAHYNMAFLHYKKGHNALASAQLQQALQYQQQAGSDVSTQRAVDRSRKLLAQLNTPIVGAPNTAIAQSTSKPQASQPAATASTQTGTATSTPSAQLASARTNVSAINPNAQASAPTNVNAQAQPVFRQANSTSKPSYATVPARDSGTQTATGTVLPSDSTVPSFSNAAYRMPSTSSIPAVPVSTKKPSAETEPTAETAAPKASPGGPMTLPEGFSFPQG